MNISGEFIKLIEYSVIGLELLYVVFAFIVVRQVRILSDSFSTPIDNIFILMARVHFLASLAFVIFSILLLL